MVEWLKNLGKALLFDSAAITYLRDHPNTFAHGILVIVVVSLLAGLPTLVADMAHALEGRVPPGVEAAEAVAGFERALDQMEVVLGDLPPSARLAADEALAQARQNFRIGLDMGTRIAALPTLLPQPLGRLLSHIGGWASRPFGSTGIPLAAATLGTWLGYGIWVMLIAKLLGGQASLAGFFGATAVFAVPHLLLIFRAVPILGDLLALIAFVWGLALYVQATAVSHGLARSQALLAVVALPILVPGIGLWTILAVSAMK